ncbi:LuxR C-terminal-related transcriptional regulator [Dactylosporangium sp. NPDC005572]|uniref:helix-turn-helix transcriptional regulator n=1 Tax=Dactylosporangium sp. NPDC005572 TaxID=3156889 RepID=UPI0033B4095E
MGVKRLLSRSRLVTLTGPGGVGKTRLALHVARSAQPPFRDGVWLVPLAELTQPDLLVSTIMSTFGTPGPASAAIAELVKHVGDRQMLLVLDNCEHLALACAGVTTALLRHCPNLRVMATSREPLRIEGEALFPVPPLSLPEPSEGPRPGAAQRYDAVALFVERASMLNPDFAVPEADEQAVIELCRRLDGLPLAIELAAASTRWLPIEALSMQVSSPLTLESGNRTAPSRQQTLRATMDYSYELCSSRARTLWARMSVFRGGADLDAIEHICAGKDLQVDDVWPALAELVDKSVVRLDGRRYRMLETVRHYGEDLLRARGQEQAVRRAYLRHFAGLATAVETGWFGPDQQALLGRVLDDQANVRAALEFCLTEPGQIRVGLRMASALFGFWIGSGRPGEGRHWLGRLLAADDEPAPERVPALWTNGFFAAVGGETSAARALLGQCVQLAPLFHDEASIAHATVSRGVAELFEGRIEEAIAHLEEGVRLERRLGGINPHLADACLKLGLALCYCGQVDRAVAVLEEAQALCAGQGEHLLRSWCSVFLGLAALLDERIPDAVVLVKAGLAGKREIETEHGMIWAVEILAWATLAGGDAERAARLLSACETRSDEVGPLLGGSKGLLEWHHRYLGQAREALGRRAFDAAVEHGWRLTIDELVAYALGEKTTEPATTTGPAADLPLTPREREVAQLVASGKSNKDIAAELVIAARTVDSHVEHILMKLNFTSRTQVAVLFAAQQASS